MSSTTATGVAGVTNPGHRAPSGGKDTIAGAKRRQALIAWGFAAPFVIIFAFFMLIPLVSSFAMSFTDFNARDVQTPLAVGFIGLDNYIELFKDPNFLQSLAVTGIFVIIGIPLTMTIAFFLAVALNNGISRFRAVFRVGFYAPVVTSIVAVSVVWRYILNNDGLMNMVLGWFGIEGPNWLNDTTWALPSLILMAVWRNVGTQMVIFLAGLQAVPPEVQEAAMMDGATAARRMWSITLPLLRPTILLNIVMISVGYLQFFEEAFVMTQGGPLGSTTSVAYFTFGKFRFGEYGMASASSYVLFIIIAILAFVQFRFLQPKD
ncbi:MAG: sugar ABC transporter permease [Cellulomonadaceae bacterium]|jgi:multiple sugar transport system permease protein|nr:sugar ABC transporter permease [Cellulomonadaceae bacterium]